MIEEALSVKWQVLSQARRAAGSRSLLTSNFRRNADWSEAIPQCVTGDGVSAQKTQTASSTLCGIPFFWAGAPKSAVLGTLALCVCGTWHVAVWIFGAKTRGTGGNWIGEADGRVFDCGLCKTNPISAWQTGRMGSESATTPRAQPVLRDAAWAMHPNGPFDAITRFTMGPEGSS